MPVESWIPSRSESDSRATNKMDTDKRRSIMFFLAGILPDARSLGDF